MSSRRGTLGDDGAVGGFADSITCSRTGDWPSTRGVSEGTTSARNFDTELAMAAARAGDSSVAEMVMTLVLRGTDVDTCRRSCEIVTSRSRDSMTGASTPRGLRSH